MSVTINGSGAITFNDGSVQNTASLPGMRNRIINGAMMIDQRNAGASGTAGGYTVDRWYYLSSQASKGTWQQNAGSVTPPVGFKNYLGFTSSSAYSVVSGDYFNFFQKIEGFNVSDLDWGTANAKPVTLSFKVYSSLTGTFGGSLTNSASSRSYPFTYTISSANTWTDISVTIAGDTTGTWLTNSSTGIQISFGLGAGSTYSGTAGAWASAQYLSATGATSVVGTNGATFYITGVQLEKGSTATSFDYRPYGQELQLCQRYFQKTYPIGIKPGDTSGLAGSGYMGSLMAYRATTTNAVCQTFQFKVSMRAVPTAIFYAPGTGNGGYFSSSTTDTIVGVNAPMTGDNNVSGYGTATAAADCYFQCAVSAEL